MSWVLDAVLNNTLFAAVMGMIVMAVSRFVRHQPAAIHAMWLIVLLKLITPPVVPVPAIVGWGFRDAVPFRAFQETPGRLPSALPMGTGAGDDRSRLHGALSSSDLVRTQSELQLPRGAGELQNEAGSEFRALVLGCWLIGTAVWTMVAAVRIFRFSRLLRVARPGSRDLVTVADRIAERLGLAKTPLIEVVDANIAPLVWHAGRTPRIVLPGEWVSRWTDEQIELVLAHEIAHVKRGDHWIRWFTLLVLAAYWWHPIAWLAVRRLRVAEE
ncbi:MAG: M56 family metallopeptidase, partial [Planctomycetales bacterium]